MVAFLDKITMRKHNFQNISFGIIGGWYDG